MNTTIRLALVALISVLAVGCLIPIPVDGHRGGHRWHDRDRYSDRSWDDGDHHRGYGDRDRGDWSRDRDYDRRHR